MGIFVFVSQPGCGAFLHGYGHGPVQGEEMNKIGLSKKGPEMAYIGAVQKVSRHII